MKILHTADWHLGRIFHGIHLTEDQSYILQDILDIALDEQVDVIVIAGDIYDRAVPPIEAVRLLNEFISKAALEHGIPVIIIAGNHDSPERMGFGSKILERNSLHIRHTFTKTPEPVLLHDQWGPVEFVPLPFVEPGKAGYLLGDDTISDHQSALKRAISLYQLSGNRTVAAAHCYTAGNTESESERPLLIGGEYSVGHTLFNGFSYTALGHLHRPQKAGAENIQYSGSIMHYSFDETDHPKSIILCTLDKEGSVSVRRENLNPKKRIRKISGSLKELLKGAELNGNETGRNDYLRVHLKDRGPLFDPLGRLREIYPNILHIERDQSAMTSRAESTSDLRKTSEKKLFQSFFEQTAGSAMTEEQEKIFTDVIDELNKTIREGNS
ncbi:MAG: exonuclease SbcCD subunit D [Spirochaetia bacterium]